MTQEEKWKAHYEEVEAFIMFNDIYKTNPGRRTVGILFCFEE